MSYYYFENYVLLYSYVDIHEVTPEPKPLKGMVYTNLALKTLFVGLKEPLQARIRSLRVRIVKEAMQFIRDEENIYYF